MMGQLSRMRINIDQEMRDKFGASRCQQAEPSACECKR